MPCLAWRWHSCGFREFWATASQPSPAGRYGTSIGFTLFIAAQILASNALGMLTDEWKQTSARTRQVLMAAVAVTLVAVIVLNLGDSSELPGRPTCLDSLRESPNSPRMVFRC